jgi:hypothetical protein
MSVSGDSKRRAADALWLSFAVAAFCIYLLGFVGIIRAGGQNTQTLSRSVTVTSDPPGAVIWKKEGRTLTCTNNITPGTFELTFHGASDVQKIRLRRFGYPSKDLYIKSTDEKVEAALGGAAPDSFLSVDDAPPDLKQLNADLKKKFEATLLADPEAFRCVPFELNFIHLMKNKETQDLTLGVAINLDRSFGGPAFRLASHAGTRDERRQKMAQAALEGGIADLLARFHRVTLNFPELKVMNVTCTYSGTEARLETESFTSTRTVGRNVVTDTDYTGRRVGAHLALEQTMVFDRDEVTVVKDQAVEKTIAFVMPTAQIPDTLDKKVITDAVLAVGKIITGNPEK